MYLVDYDLEIQSRLDTPIEMNNWELGFPFMQAGSVPACNSSISMSPNSAESRSSYLRNGLSETTSLSPKVEERSAYILPSPDLTCGTTLGVIWVSTSTAVSYVQRGRQGNGRDVVAVIT
ncbi:hypothetical protein H5410_018823 [Solanum commersonii]|uniref:Uncharacterized protein n=1 Tax=Solanum commersonii TaxID=4109 RepID=A0A9J6A4I2_SOLCO|nr:hypothetical protein H5410_018823 [Solanum commersonii]